MKNFKWLGVVVLSAYAVVFASGLVMHRIPREVHAGNDGIAAPGETEFAKVISSSGVAPDASRYRLEPARSKFIAHAFAGGLLWFKGHDHLVAVRDFTGEARLNPDSLSASSLEIVAKAASMGETSSVFTEPQKQIINKELRDIVLLPDQYPDITFRSTGVTGKMSASNQYELKIAGNLTLLGVTRPVTIPTKVTVSGNELRAQGEFSIDRSDYKVKATSAFHGMVRVRDKVRFEFDVVGQRF
jgi:polyisoprenoid-binding protein YceI